MAAAEKPARNLRAEFTNLPNILTMGRVAIVPLVLYFIDNYSPTRSFIATLLYIAASVTDFFDGYLARKRGQVSVLGKFLDPLADKLIVMAALVFLVAAGRAPAWLAVALEARELAVTGLRGIATQEGLVIAASYGGKSKTALQLVGILFLLVHFKYPLLGFPQHVVDYHVVGLYTLYLSLVMSVFSAAEYVKLFVQAVTRQSSKVAA
ncbi:MAG TPA: CDP-diacylglycerol--glycerol-3-phosphate 3-phosphatidyltransferase [Polyangia bacterium]|nr:CDP-diacylglycerol--glycerol-3-phosphate 3-phosphatidyltransferase [Polyangia bacterium]